MPEFNPFGPPGGIVETGLDEVAKYVAAIQSAPAARSDITRSSSGAEAIVTAIRHQMGDGGGGEPPVVVNPVVTPAGAVAPPAVVEAGVPAIVGAGAGALAPFIGRAIPWIMGAIGGATMAGMFDGNGGGGNGAVPGLSPYGVPFVGPGLKEPAAQYLLKEWHITNGGVRLQYYLVQTPRGTKRIFMYNTRTKAWKSWAMPRLAVIGKNMPSHKMLTRLRRNLKKHSADAKTILMVASPTTYAKQLGYRKYKRRR